MKFYIEGDNGVLLECESVDIKDGETLKVTIDTEKWNIDQSAEAFSQVCKLFPKNKVLGLLNGMTLVKEIEPDV